MILANIWRCKRARWVYVVVWKAPAGWLYLGPADSWRVHPQEAQTFAHFADAADASGRGEGQVVGLGWYEPWCGSGWAPAEVTRTLAVELHRLVPE